MPKKYCFIVNEETKEVRIGVGVNDEYYLSIGMQEFDVEQAYDGRWFLSGYAPAKKEPTLEEKILTLENETGLTRPVRELVLAENSGSSDYVKQKAQEIEQMAQVLRISDDQEEIQEALNAETIVNLMEK